MTGACLQAPGGFVGGTLAAIDCRAAQVAEQGVRVMGLAGPFGPAIAGLLTIAVALVGYRMLMGDVPRLRDGTMLAARIGVVLMVATSWPAVRILVTDTALAGPAEVAGAIGRPVGLGAASGGLAARLDGAAQGLGHAADLLVQPASARDGPPPPARAPGAAPVPSGQDASPPAPPTESPAAATLRQTRVVFLTASVGGLATVHLVAGLLLAVAPLVVAFLLFDATRGLVEGWLRVLAAAILAGAGIALALAIELTLLLPRVDAAVALAEAGGSVDTAAIELLALACLFAALQIGVLVASPIAVARVRLPRRSAVATDPAPSVISHRAGVPAATLAAVARPPHQPPSRALAIAGSVAATQRREAAVAAAAMVDGSHTTTTGMRSQPAGDHRAGSLRTGGSRSSARRVSASVDRRDRRA